MSLFRESRNDKISANFLFSFDNLTLTDWHQIPKHHSDVVHEIYINAKHDGTERIYGSERFRGHRVLCATTGRKIYLLPNAVSCKYM